MSVRFLVLILSAMIVGCSLTAQVPYSRPQGIPSEHQQLIAEELSNVLLQLDEIKGRTSAFELTKKTSNDVFPKSVISFLEGAGYKIQRITKRRSENTLKYSVEKRISPYRTTYLYSVSVGDVSVEREYIPRDGAIYPYSMLRIAGSKTRVNPFDGVYLRQNPQQDFPSGVQFVTPVRKPTESDQTVQNTAQAEPHHAPDINSAKPWRSMVVTRELLDDSGLVNPYQEGNSNYKSSIEKLILINEEVVSFTNDSKQLDREGEAQLRGLIARKDRANDLFHITGCSHGHTPLINGNEELAKERALRIAQELYVLGVPPRKLVAEACWSPRTFDSGGHPRRGAVVHIYNSE